MAKRLLTLTGSSLVVACVGRTAPPQPPTPEPVSTESEAPPPPQDGEPTPEGDFDRRGIDREVQARLVDIRACYDTLPEDRAAEGQLLARFLVDDQGHAVNLELESETLDDPELVSCVAGVLRSISFPAAPTGEAIAVTYPFVFRAQ